MGDMLTKVIEAIAEGKGTETAEQQMIKLGVAKLPEVRRDNTDRNRTSPFAFTGQKFEFRAVGSSASIAFPVTLLNVAVADAIGEISATLRETLKKTKGVNEAVLKVVRQVFKETAPIRFEGNNYSEEWVKDAKKRGLPNLRRTPEALKEMISKQSRKVLTDLGVLTKEELESRYHVRVERYVKDMLIELHTLREIVDTMVIPAAFTYLNQLTEASAQAKAAGIAVIPQIATANQIGELVQELQEHREDLTDVIARAEAKHEDPAGQAEMLTTEGADTMAEVRKGCDALELLVADDCWPLPKYREMLFPV
jgi:glutamine synthetase